MTVTSRWTSADLEQFPDDPALRYEIIDGELYVSKAPNWYHQVVVDEIGDTLRQWCRATGQGQATSGPGVIPPDDDNVIPDIIWISHERLAAGLGDDGKLHLLPELVVEVLAPGVANERRDTPTSWRSTGGRAHASTGSPTARCARLWCTAPTAMY